jgi:branched-subunit amino acid aminotransferase/4-amino-4-deoxychorismate lyase
MRGMEPLDATTEPLTTAPSTRPAADPDPESAAAVLPTPLAWSDGRVLVAAEATVPLLDDGFLRGDTVFEAMLVRRGRTHALDDHLARMGRSAGVLDLPLPDLRPVVAALLTAWGEHDGVVRLYVTRGGAVRGVVGAMAWPPSIALAVVTMPWRTALSGVKSVSYAANQWAQRQAVSLGADDALIVDRDRVHELPTGAVCLVRDGKLSCPDPQRLPILDSVTVRHLARVVELAFTVPTLDDVRAADEIFVLSATRPVLPVHAVLLGPDERLALSAPGPVTAKVAGAFTEYIAASLDPRP